MKMVYPKRTEVAGRIALGCHMQVPFFSKEVADKALQIACSVSQLFCPIRCARVRARNSQKSQHRKNKHKSPKKMGGKNLSRGSFTN